MRFQNPSVVLEVYLTIQSVHYSFITVVPLDTLSVFIRDDCPTIRSKLWYSDTSAINLTSILLNPTFKVTFIPMFPHNTIIVPEVSLIEDDVVAYKCRQLQTKSKSIVVILLWFSANSGSCRVLLGVYIVSQHLHELNLFSGSTCL